MMLNKVEKRKSSVVFEIFVAIPLCRGKILTNFKIGTDKREYYTIVINFFHNFTNEGV